MSPDSRAAQILLMPLQVVREGGLLLSPDKKSDKSDISPAEQGNGNHCTLTKSAFYTSGRDGEAGSHTRSPGAHTAFYRLSFYLLNTLGGRGQAELVSCRKPSKESPIYTLSSVAE